MITSISVDQIIEIHQHLIKEFGGDTGIRDQRLLESAVGRMQTGYYSGVIEYAAALMESLAINHPFIDGNKRVSFFCADLLLRLNGFYISCSSDEGFNFYKDNLDAGSFKFDVIVPWLQRHAKPL